MAKNTQATTDSEVPATPPANDTPETTTPTATTPATETKPKGPGKGVRQELFSVSKEQLESVNTFDSRGIMTTGGIDPGAFLQANVNRLRNAYDKWLAAKTNLRATRRDWQALDALVRANGAGGPSIAELLKTAKDEESKTIAAQGEALNSGDFEAAKTLFVKAGELRKTIAELEDKKGAKGDKSELETKKSEARSAWSAAQKVEAAARVHLQIGLFQTLKLATPLDDAQAESYRKFLGQGVKSEYPYSADDLTANTDELVVDDTNAEDDKDETPANDTTEPTPPTA